MHDRRRPICSTTARSASNPCMPAPGVPEVSETLAKLQIPPDFHYPPATTTSVVPLPRHAQAGTGQHQVALLIREGRRAAQQLVASMGDVSRDSGSSKETSASPDSAVTMTSMSTALLPLHREVLLKRRRHGCHCHCRIRRRARLLTRTTFSAHVTHAGNKLLGRPSSFS